MVLRRPITVANVLLLYESMIPSIRLCVYEQFYLLDKQEIINFRSVKFKEISREDFKWCDIVIFVRSGNHIEMKLVKYFKDMGKYLVYVLDDDLLNIPNYVSCYKSYNNPKMHNRIKTIMSLCDCLLSPSPELLKKYGKYFDKMICIEEASLGNNEHNIKRNSNSPIRIGFAGSIDRVGDIENIISDAVGNIVQKYGKKVEIEFFGAKPSFADKLGLKYTPYCESYDEYRQIMSKNRWDIGLAPMLDTPFNNCKHYNKFIEYSGYGIVGIYSDVKPYNEIVRSGDNGLLCKNTTEGWTDAISLLIDNQDLLHKISDRCFNEAQTTLSVAATASKLQNAFGEILKYKASKKILFRVRFWKTIYGVSMGRDIIERHGLGVFKAIRKRIFRKLGFVGGR